MTTEAEPPPLADVVLPKIRTRRDLNYRSVANQHGHSMQRAADILRDALATHDPAEVYAVTQKAITSAISLILRADDSDGQIGGAIETLLEIHPRAAALAKPSPARLVKWMIDFQFDGKQDFFDIDPVAYADALGEPGMKRYRAKLNEVAAGLGPPPTPEEERELSNWFLADEATRRKFAGWRHVHFVLDYNARRLAVYDRDIDAIIATHLRDRQVAAWIEDTARALDEIGEHDLAIDYAKQATEFEPDHQAAHASRLWCELLTEHRPSDLLDARRLVFGRWPTADNAIALRDAAGERWPDFAEEVAAAMSADPRQAVLFAIDGLKDGELAWRLAHEYGLRDKAAWSRVVTAYQKVDPVAVLPVLANLVKDDLVRAEPWCYRDAAKRLVKMCKLAAGTERAAGVEAFIAELRSEHRNRPRLQTEFSRARLP